MAPLADPVPAESYPTMSRKKKDRQEKNGDDSSRKSARTIVVNDSAATLSCAAGTAGDFATNALTTGGLDFDLPYLHWRSRSCESPSGPVLHSWRTR